MQKSSAHMSSIFPPMEEQSKDNEEINGALKKKNQQYTAIDLHI